MTETEELQAQIDALRLLVMSLIAQSPTDALIKDARIRLETWEDMHVPSEVSDSYLDLMQAERERALETLHMLKEQHDERAAQELPDTSSAPTKPLRTKTRRKTT